MPNNPSKDSPEVELPENLNNKVIVILGPTSSGKSSLAIKIAEDFNGEIISVDSRQVFKNMDLGTGKINGKWEKINNKKVYTYKNIPHHLIDFINPEEDYNVSHFKRDCEEKILEILERGKVPILCGGTGFWIQAIIDDVILPKVEPNPKLRQKLNKKSAPELFKILKKLDSNRANNIDCKNKARLIRAIEIAEELGKIPKIKIDQRNNKRKIKGKSVDFLQIGIPIDKYKLAEKIKTRLGERFNDGMVEEILELNEKYNLSKEKIQVFGLAYALVPLYEKGEITRKELFDKIAQAEKKYAKRQMTWFKKDPRIFWSNDYTNIKEKIKKFLTNSI